MVTVMDAEWLRVPFAPVTVIVYTLPGAKLPGTNMVTVEFPSPRAGTLTVVGLTETEGPVEETVSLTRVAMLLMLVIVTLETPEVPAPILSAAGAEETPKSTTPAVMIWKCVIEPAVPLTVTA